MIEGLRELPSSVLIFLLIVGGYVLIGIFHLGAWIFKQWWDSRKENLLLQTQALQQNTLAIQKLQLQMERLNEFLHIIPKLQTDVAIAHQKIRDLSNESLVE